MNTERQIYVRAMEREAIISIQAGMYNTAMIQIKDLIYYYMECAKAEISE